MNGLSEDGVAVFVAAQELMGLAIEHGIEVRSHDGGWKSYSGFAEFTWRGLPVKARGTHATGSAWMVQKGGEIIFS
jgi:hypothetical protein